jgi:hypothetical protein
MTPPSRPGRRIALLVLALAQLAAAPVVSAFGGGAFTTADRAGEPAIVPAGYAFSIWLVIEVLCLVYAVWALPASRPDPVLRDRLAGPLLVVFAGFSAWLVAADLEPVFTTLVVLAAMVGGLLVAVGRALAARSEIARWGRFGATAFWTMAGLYLGWTSIAIWLNLTTTLTSLGAPLTGPVGVAGQLAVLVGATATAVALVRWTHAQPAYVAAVAWAFVGAVIGAAGAGEPVLAVAAGVGLVAVAAGALATLRARTRAGSRAAH